MKDINQTEELFDGIFRESLENASAQVPPGVWEGISGTVGSASAAGAATQAAIWMKAAIAVIAVAGASYFAYTSFNKGENGNPPVTNPSSQVPTPETAISPETKTSETESHTTTILNNPAKNTQPYSIPSKPLNPVNENSGPDNVQPNSNYSIDANLEPNPGTPTVTPVPDRVEPVKGSESSKPNPNMPEPTLDKNHNSYTYVKDSSYIFVPNAVTPDGDGINDNYQIKLVGEESFEIIIYSLDNQILYRSNNKYQSWNCKLPNGEDAPAGSYVVKVIYKFKGQEEKTDIQKLTLIK